MPSEEFACPHCASRHSRVFVTMSTPDRDVEICGVCEEVMARWDSRQVPVFRLVAAAPPALPLRAARDHVIT